MLMALAVVISPVAAARADTTSVANTTGSSITGPNTTVAGSGYPGLKAAPDDGHLKVVLASPSGKLRGLEQAVELRWVFDRPVVDLTGLAQQRDPSQFITMSPAIPGQYRWASSRTLIFTPDEPVKASSSYSVTLAGLTGLDGSTMVSPSTLSFTTPTVTCAVHDVDSEDQLISTNTVITLSCDQEVDLLALAAKVMLQVVPSAMTPAEFQPAPADLAAMRTTDPTGTAALEASIAALGKRSTTTVAVKAVKIVLCAVGSMERCYQVVAAGPIPDDSDVRIRISAGLASGDGPLLSIAHVAGSYPTPQSLLLRSEQCNVGCDPDDRQLISLYGKTPSLESLDGGITVTDLTAKTAPRTYRYSATSDSGDPLALRWLYLIPTHKYRVDLHSAAFGYEWVRTFTLGRRANFTHLPGGETVVEANAAGAAAPAVRVSIRNVTELEQVHLRLDDKDVVASVRSFENVPGAQPFDAGKFRASRVRVSPPLDAERRARIELKEPGVWLVAVRPTAKVPGSIYESTDELGGGSSTDTSVPDSSVPGTTNAQDRPKPEEWQSTLVQVTDLGVTVKRSPSNILVAVTSLGTAKAVSGASVKLFGRGKEIWKGTSDAAGFALADAADLGGCDSSCDLIAVVEHNKQLAYGSAQWREWGDDIPYVNEDVGDGGSSTTVRPDVPTLPPGQRFNAALFTDRGVYKLGEEGHVKGIVRIETARTLELPTNLKKVRIQIADDRGTKVMDKSVPISTTGEFDTAFTLPIDGNQGSYSVQLDGVSGYVGFIVASFRKPDFKVDVTAKQPEWVRGDTVVATTEGRYLFGAAMDGRDVTWTANTFASSWDPAADHPELRLDGFRWAPYCFDYTRCEGSSSNEAGKGVSTLTAEGTLAIKVPVEVQTRPHTTSQMTIESEVTDVNRQAIANRTSVTIHPGDYYVGIRTARSFIKKGEQFSAELAALTSKGAWVPGKQLSAQLIRWEWVRAKRQAGSDQVESGTWQPTVESTQPFASATALVKATFTPSTTGTYELRLSSTDARGNYLEAGVDVYVTGSGYVPWYDPSVQGDQRSVTLLQERSQYTPGDTARILIQSPWPNAEAIITTERGAVLSAKRVTITGSATTVEVPVTAESVPNVYVAVTLFKPRTSAPDGDGDAGRPEVKESSTSLSVLPSDRELGVTVSVPKAEERPGAATTASVKVTAPKGGPSKATVTLWAVDEGVLRLSGYSLPDIISQLNPERSDEVTTSDSRMRLVALDRNGGLERSAAAAQDKGGEALAPAPSYVDPGGGGGEDSTVDGVRRDFRTLAAWAGSVEVGSDGTAQVPIKLPESLSEFRVLAVASEGANRFGGGITTVKVAQPFAVVPSLPRFLQQGDTAEVGVVVQNRTGKPGTATVQLDLGTGVAGVSPLSAVGTTSQTVTVPVGATEVRFPLSANALGIAKLTVRGTFEADGIKEQDAAEATLPVQLTRRLESTMAAGDVDAGKSVTETLSVPANIIPGVGGLEITTASTALVGLQNGIEELVEYPYGCLEQRSSRLKVLLNLKALGSQYALGSLPLAKLDATIKAELLKFKDYHVYDGGLSYWPGESRSDPWLTAGVLSLMVDAKALGYVPPAGLIEETTNYLQTELDKFGDAKGDDDQSALWWSRGEILAALAKAGRMEPKLNLALFKERIDLSLDEQISLMNSMLTAGQVGSEASTLLRELRNSILVEGDRAYAQANGLYSTCSCFSWLYADDTHLTAELLTLLLRIDPAEPLAPKMARWLLAQRNNGTWQNTYEDGSALSALVSYARTQEAATPDFDAEVLLGASKVVEEHFAGRQLTARTKQVATDQLPTAKMAVQIKATGQGRLSYALRLRYAPNLATLKPVDAGFTVERTYAPYRKAGSSTVTPTRTPTTVAAPDRSGARTRGNNTATFQAGDLVTVRLRITTTQRRQNVVIEDPLPAGMEALDAQLASTSQADTADVGSSDTGWYAGIDHTEIRDDRVLLFATSLENGTLVYTYVARATAPGDYTVAPTQAEEMYRPEIFGRGGTVQVKITAPRP